MTLVWTPTRDNPFPDWLKVGQLCYAKDREDEATVIQQAIYLEYLRQNSVHKYIAVFGVASNRYLTSIEAYQSFAAERQTSNDFFVKWLVPHEQASAGCVALLNGDGVDTHRYSKTFPNHTVMSREEWELDKHTRTQRDIQKVIMRLYKRQQYYKQYVEGITEL